METHEVGTLRRMTLFVGLSLLYLPAVAADDVNVISVTATGLIATIEQVAPVFERATGHRIVSTFDLAPDLLKRLDDGEVFDLVIVTPALIDELAQRGHVSEIARADLARTSIGVCVQAGATKPDIGSVETIRRTLLAAKSIAYNPAVASGRHAAEVFQRLGIANEVAGKLVSAEHKPGPNKVTGVVARGEAELGLVITTDIVADAGVALAGPLPEALQSYVTFTAGVSERGKHTSAAKAFLDFLQTPLSRSVIEHQGMELPR